MASLSFISGFLIVRTMHQHSGRTSYEHSTYGHFQKVQSFYRRRSPLSIDFGYAI